MVDINMLGAEVMAAAMGRKPEDDGADPLKELIPAYARIQVRLCDRTALDDCADLLSSLSQQLRLLARRHDITQSQMLFYAWREIQTANTRMQDSTRYRKEK